MPYCSRHRAPAHWCLNFHIHYAPQGQGSHRSGLWCCGRQGLQWPGVINQGQQDRDSSSGQRKCSCRDEGADGSSRYEVGNLTAHVSHAAGCVCLCVCVSATRPCSFVGTQWCMCKVHTDTDLCPHEDGSVPTLVLVLDTLG